jgi:hypothetical protein
MSKVSETIFSFFPGFGTLSPIINKTQVLTGDTEDWLYQITN